MRGARAVHRVITHEVQDIALAAMIVWIEMLPEDREADLEALTEEMRDHRIQWFHDPKQRVGQAMATSLGAPGKIAWDVYLFFGKDKEWKNKMPSPSQWIHQLDDLWADPMHRCFSDQLELELRRLLRSMSG